MNFWTVIAAALLIAFVSWYWRQRCRRITDELETSRRANTALTKQFEEKIARLQAQEAVTFNSMAEGILLLDLDWRIRFANQAFRDLFDIKADVCGLTLVEALRSPELSEMQENLRERDTIEALELDVPGLNRPRIEVNASVVRDDQKQRYGAVFVFRDITRLRQLEKTRTEFVANVSHELRTPLSMIKGYVETLLDKGVEDRTMVERFLHTVKKHTDRLTFLIEDLLTLSHLESGETTMKINPVKLRPIVERVVDDLHQVAEQKGAVIENTIGAEVAASADADRIEQVFFNLVENAIKYGRPGGHVRITALTGDTKVQVAVADDGPGIPPDARDRVFERFYRVDRARSRETGGTGLGLSIVKHIVQAHGGTVWVESEVEEGATFFFTLPGV